MLLRCLMKCLTETCLHPLGPKLLLFSTKNFIASLHASLLATSASFQLHPLKRTFSQLFQESSYLRRLEVGKAAHGQMIRSGFSPTIFVTNCLIDMYIKCEQMGYAHNVFSQMHLRDIISWNAMVFGYASCGLVGQARSLFDAMPEKDVVSWNSLISGYLQNGFFWKSIEIFVMMGQMGMRPDQTTFAVVLKSCSGLENYELGIQIHCRAVIVGLDFDVMTGSALVDMYAKCKSLDDSGQIFKEMSVKNSVSWSAVIAGYAQNGKPLKSLKVFKEMQQMCVEVSQSTYASVFRSCAGLGYLEIGQQLHGHALKTNYGLDSIVGNAILDMYAKCDSLADSWKVFMLFPKRGLESWNAIIVGCIRNNKHREAFRLFQLMQTSGIRPDEITLSGALSSCAGLEGLNEGSQVHTLVLKLSFNLDTCVGNAILDMYGKCGALTESSIIFYEMKIRDAVSWNAIIAAFGQNGKNEETLVYYCQMLRWHMEPDEFTYGSVLKVCAALQDLHRGTEVHGQIIKHGLGFDTFVGIATIDMYCKCGNVEEARKLHSRIKEQSLVSWNAIISGYATQKQSEEAQRFFSRMLEAGLEPDNFTYATIIDTCANLATVGLGRQMHAQIFKRELQTDVYIASTLVDMYSKCGVMHDSLLMFEKMKEKDLVTWNAMISGYSQHGLGLEAIHIFQRMELEGVKPNHATFLSVLRACSYIGLFDEGSRYFYLMVHHYGLEPHLEHFSCMVDILGRSGRVDEALQLILDMPLMADAVIWRTLLSVCKLQGNVGIAEQAATALLELDPQDSSVYVLLSNIYAEAGNWVAFSGMRKLMRHHSLKKEPGCSWIEVQNEVHAFLVGDKAHPRCDALYERLGVLITDMKLVGYVPDIHFSVDGEEDDGNYRPGQK